MQAHGGYVLRSLIKYRIMKLIIGILSATFVVLNTALNCIPLYLAGIVRGLLHLLGLRTAARWIANHMDWIIESWVGANRQMFRALHLTRIEIDWIDCESLSRDDWYMVISNHQSWTDIVVLQVALHRHIPPIKFFTKAQLIWIPLLGIAMWLLGFPYVRRLSKAQIEASPELLELDRKATLQSCEGFRAKPTTVLNFLEGTRFTPSKHGAQQARYRTLLNPKTGGFTYVVAALERELHQVLDVTIEYPHGIPTFWDFMTGNCPQVRLRVERLEIPAEIRDAESLEEKRPRLQAWIDSLWQAKDARLIAGGRLTQFAAAD